MWRYELNTYLYKIFIYFVSISLLACSSPKAKKQKLEEKRQEQREKDSLSLLYDSVQRNVEIDAFMQNLHRKSGFNGNVLVAKSGKIIYQNSFGWADYLHKDSLKITSKFELASVSKPLTGLGILKLVEEKKIRLDQTIGDFYADFPYPGITLEMLLSHRSGLPNYIYFSEEAWTDKKKAMTNADAMNLLIAKKPGRYGAPNGRFHYNNSNFMVLAAIIEKVTGQSFEEYMRETVFEPAGMVNTAVLSKAVYEDIPTDVVGHDRVWRRSVVQNYLDGPVGDKGIYSTVQDLFLLDIALKEGRIVDKNLLDSAYVPRSKPWHGYFSYGYGWRTFSPETAQIVYHTGWWHGFRNLYVRDLTNDITIVFLSNLVNGSLLRLDDLYKILKMPILRQNAYNSNGDFIAN